MSFKQQAIKSKLQLSYKDVWHENDRKLKFKPPHAEYVCKSTNSWTPDFHISDFFFQVFVRLLCSCDSREGRVSLCLAELSVGQFVQGSERLVL